MLIMWMIGIGIEESEMKDEQSRRQFLKWVGVAPVSAMLILESACGTASSPDVRGSDTAVDGGTERDAGARRSAKMDATQPRDAGGENAPETGYPSKDAESVGDTGADVAPEADGGVCEATGSDVEGPFHLEGAPSRTTLAGQDEPGERIVVEGTIYEPDCRTPVAGASLDVWHADANGDYDDSTTEYRLRGQMQTGADGTYRLESIMPGRYPLGGSTRPAHIHFIVSKPGFTPLTTQMYFEGDPFLSPNDPCGSGCNSGDPTLLVPFSDTVGGAKKGTFDIVLSRP